MASMLSLSSSATLAGTRLSSVISRSRPVTRPVRSFAIRSEASKDPQQTVQERAQQAQSFVDSTKVNISREDVLKNQEENKDEKRSILGAKPAEGSSTWPRPEVERRPETGDISFGSLMAIDGAGPETINGRLAMLGVFIALGVEAYTGKSVVDQVLGAGGDRRTLLFFGLTQLIFVASLIPFARRESPDSRKSGPFTAKAERWNGRLAMVGFAGILIGEAIKGGALLPHLF